VKYLIDVILVLAGFVLFVFPVAMAIVTGSPDWWRASSMVWSVVAALAMIGGFWWLGMKIFAVVGAYIWGADKLSSIFVFSGSLFGLLLFIWLGVPIFNQYFAWK